MKPLWHPTSALLAADLEYWASPVMLRLPLASAGRAVLRYVGDHMWPAFPHGERIDVVPLAGVPRRGDAVVVRSGGTVELSRVQASGEERLRIVADADPDTARDIPVRDVLGVVAGSRRRPPSRVRRTLRRAWLDVAEAWRGGDAPPGALSVRDKYDRQADDYATLAFEPPDADWGAAIARHVESKGSIVVIGCGAGKECFMLSRSGFRVHGVDFAARMVLQARRLAVEAEVRGVEFHLADAASFQPPEGPVDGVLFTPDVYSFVPERSARLALLRHISAWLASGAPLLLSARIVTGVWRRLVLAVEWLRSAPRLELGDSHTRYFTPDGIEHRSFVHCFSPRSLQREIRAAGYEWVARERSFQVLRPRMRSPKR